MKCVFAFCFQHHRTNFVNMLFFLTIKRQSWVLNTNVNYEDNVFWLASLINFTFLAFSENQEKTVIRFHWQSVNFDSFIASKVHHNTPCTFTRKNKVMQFKNLKWKKSFSEVSEFAFLRGWNQYCDDFKIKECRYCNGIVIERINLT